MDKKNEETVQTLDNEFELQVVQHVIFFLMKEQLDITFPEGKLDSIREEVITKMREKYPDRNIKYGRTN